MSVISRLKKRFYFVAARYFRFFANFAFRRWHPRVIAVTGSVGKTTMLHMIEYQLGKKAHYSHDANSAFGIAFDMVGIKGIRGSKWRWLYLLLAVPFRSLWYRHTEPFYIVEIDGERPHEAEFVASWLKPEVSLWISFGLSHAVQFDAQVKAGTFSSLSEAISHEFATIPAHTTGQVYIDGDVKEMLTQTKNISAKVIKCYKKELKKYTVYPESSDFTVAKTTFHFNNPQPRDLTIQLVMLEKLANYLKIKLNPDFSGLKMPPGRSSFFPGKNGLKLIDSSYNAHLISMEAILDMAKAMKCQHKWLVIGDMVEQGSIEKQEHQRLAEAIIVVKPEQVVTIGRRTKQYTAPLLEAAGLKVFATTSTQQALNFITKNTTGQETLIFKGSQYLEWILEHLLQNPSDASLLPRRESGAKHRRAKRGLN